MCICVTCDIDRIQERTVEIDMDHPKWKYGMLVSNFAKQSVISKAMLGWNIGYKGRNAVLIDSYGS